MFVEIFGLVLLLEIFQILFFPLRRCSSGRPAPIKNSVFSLPKIFWKKVRVPVSHQNTVRSALRIQFFFFVPNMSEMCLKLFWDLSGGFETFPKNFDKYGFLLDFLRLVKTLSRTPELRCYYAQCWVPELSVQK